MAPVERSRFGALLRSYRIAAGLTQAKLADLAGVSERGISDLERGVNQVAWISTAHALADALNLDPAQRERLFAARQRITPLLPTDARAQSPLTSQFPASLALIGRANERAQIEQLLAGDGSPMLVFFGEPGIGKTRLLQYATERAQQAGWTVLYGGSQQSDGQHPYAPLIEMLERSLAEHSLKQRRQLLKGCEWMARLLPEVSEVAPMPSQVWQAPPEQERRSMFAAVGRYLERLADPTGALLVLDDLQWATPDALSLLGSLFRSGLISTRPGQLRVVAASRDALLDTSHPLPGMVMELARENLLSRASLGPLEMQHADMLLHAALADVEGLSSDEREAIIRKALLRAAGVPFFLMSFAREIHASRSDGAQALAPTDVPWDIAEMTRQRVNSLPPEARDVVSIAAVYGREAPLDLLASAGALTEQQLIEAIEAACSAGLLDETDNAACMFRHDLIREAVLANLSAARAHALHRRVAQALEADPRRAPVEPLAFHYGQSTDTGRAIFYLERAADQAVAVRGYAAAEACYRDALSRLISINSTSGIGRVQEKLGALLMGSGKYMEAIEALRGAAASFRRIGDPDGVGRVAAQIGWAHVRGGTGSEGLSYVEPLLEPETLATLAPQTQVALWRAHAVLLFAQNRYREQLASAQRAVRLAREASDTLALAQSMRLEGLALVQAGQLDEALPVLLETIRVAEIVGDLDSMSAALNDTAAVYRERGEFTSTWTYTARAVEVAEQMDDPTAIAFLTSTHGDAAYLLGDWATARRCFERAVDVARNIGASWVTAYPLSYLAVLNFAEGQDEAGLRLLREALTLAEQDHDLQALCSIQAAYAERDLLRGAAAAALQWLQPTLEHAGSAEKDAITLLPLLAWAYLSLGETARAAETLDQCMGRAEAMGTRIVILDALLMQARLHIYQAEWSHARKALDDALDRSQAMAYPYAEAKARFIYGQLHAAMHELEQARAQYEQALALCHRLHESRYQAYIEQALRDLPRR